MTLNYERRNAVLNTAEFLVKLCDPKQTPRVPLEVRNQARALLRHYPGVYDMDIAGETCPRIFGKDWKEQYE